MVKHTYLVDPDPDDGTWKVRPPQFYHLNEMAKKYVAILENLSINKGMIK
jgi:hypothetical protein